jgi:hypothetical protein
MRAARKAALYQSVTVYRRMETQTAKYAPYAMPVWTHEIQVPEKATTTSPSLYLGAIAPRRDRTRPRERLQLFWRGNHAIPLGVIGTSKMRVEGAQKTDEKDGRIRAKNGQVIMYSVPGLFLEVCKVISAPRTCLVARAHFRSLSVNLPGNNCSRSLLEEQNTPHRP